MEAKAKDDFPYRDCKIAIQVRKVMGDGIFSEAYEFDRVVAIQEKEKQNANKMIDDALVKLQNERFGRELKTRERNSDEELE